MSAADSVVCSLSRRIAIDGEATKLHEGTVMTIRRAPYEAKMVVRGDTPPIYTSLNGRAFFQSNVSYNGYTTFCEKKQDTIFTSVHTK